MTYLLLQNEVLRYHIMTLSYYNVTYYVVIE